MSRPPRFIGDSHFTRKAMLPGWSSAMLHLRLEPFIKRMLQDGGCTLYQSGYSSL